MKYFHHCVFVVWSVANLKNALWSQFTTLESNIVNLLFRWDSIVVHFDYRAFNSDHKGLILYSLIPAHKDSMRESSIKNFWPCEQFHKLLVHCRRHHRLAEQQLRPRAVAGCHAAWTRASRKSRAFWRRNAGLRRKVSSFQPLGGTRRPTWSNVWRPRSRRWRSTPASSCPRRREDRGLIHWNSALAKRQIKC